MSVNDPQRDRPSAAGSLGGAERQASSGGTGQRVSATVVSGQPRHGRGQPVFAAGGRPTAMNDHAAGQTVPMNTAMAPPGAAASAVRPSATSQDAHPALLPAGTLAPLQRSDDDGNTRDSARRITEVARRLQAARPHPSAKPMFTTAGQPVFEGRATASFATAEPQIEGGEVQAPLGDGDPLPDHYAAGPDAAVDGAGAPGAVSAPADTDFAIESEPLTDTAPSGFLPAEPGRADNGHWRDADVDAFSDGHASASLHVQPDAHSEAHSKAQPKRQPILQPPAEPTASRTSAFEAPDAPGVRAHNGSTWGGWRLAIIAGGIAAAAILGLLASGVPGAAAPFVLATLSVFSGIGLFALAAYAFGLVTRAPGGRSAGPEYQVCAHLERIGAPVVLSDDTGAIAFANASARDVFDLPPASSIEDINAQLAILSGRPGPLTGLAERLIHGEDVALTVPLTQRWGRHSGWLAQWRVPGAEDRQPIGLRVEARRLIEARTQNPSHPEAHTGPASGMVSCQWTFSPIMSARRGDLPGEAGDFDLEAAGVALGELIGPEASDVAIGALLEPAGGTCDAAHPTLNASADGDGLGDDNGEPDERPEARPSAVPSSDALGAARGRFAAAQRVARARLLDPLLSVAPMPVLLIDWDGQAVIGNDAAATTLNAPGLLEGTALSNVLTPESIDALGRMSGLGACEGASPVAPPPGAAVVPVSVIRRPAQRMRLRVAPFQASSHTQHNLMLASVEEPGETAPPMAQGHAAAERSSANGTVVGTANGVAGLPGQSATDAAGCPASVLDDFERVFDFAPIAVASVRADGHLVKANPAFHGLFGRTGENDGAATDAPLTGGAACAPSQTRIAALNQIVGEENHARLADAIQAALRHGRGAGPIDLTFGPAGRYSAQAFVAAVEVLPEQAGDSVSPAAARDIAAADQDAESSVLIYAVETTQQRELEARFAQSQKMQAVGQLAGGMAHDFNNVLTTITLSSDFLLGSHRPSDPAFKDIMAIKQNASRAAGIVRQLLAFSRQQTLRPRVLNLTEVIQDWSIWLSSILDETIELDVTYGSDLWPIKADQTQFEQVIMNLAVNARDAMPDGGSLAIRTYNLGEDKVRSDLSETLPAGDYVVCEVSDTGTGMPRDVVEKIFEPFFSTKEVGKGTGLGLSMVYGIIKQTGGFIFCDSAVGIGTTFRIYLPRHVGVETEVEPARKPSASAATLNLTGSGTVLLVEDEEAVRKFAARALSRQGYKVLEAGSGTEALEVFMAAEQRVDLVVSDIVMPEMDGPTLLKELRRSQPDLRIIFISGYAEDALKTLDDNDDFMYLAKPFQLKDLVATVKSALSGERSV